MGLLGDILKIGLPILGTAIAPGVGTALGGAAGSALSGGGSIGDILKSALPHLLSGGAGALGSALGGGGDIKSMLLSALGGMGVGSQGMNPAIIAILSQAMAEERERSQAQTDFFNERVALQQGILDKTIDRDQMAAGGFGNALDVLNRFAQGGTTAGPGVASDIFQGYLDRKRHGFIGTGNINSMAGVGYNPNISSLMLSALGSGDRTGGASRPTASQPAGPAGPPLVPRAPLPSDPPELEFEGREPFDDTVRDSDLLTGESALDAARQLAAAIQRKRRGGARNREDEGQERDS